MKEANAQLVSSAFNGDRDREFREKERALRIQIAQLEATIKADLGERGSLLDKLTLERGRRISPHLPKMFINLFQIPAARLMMINVPCI